MNLTQKLFSRARTMWVNHRDAIVLEDLEKSLESATRLNNHASYIPADFMFIQASYAFARGEEEKGKDICRKIQSIQYGYDPSQRFYLNLPSEVKNLEDLREVSEEAIQLQVAEAFLSTFLKTYPSYTFTDFSRHFPLQETITRENMIKRLGMEKDDITKKG